MKAKDRNSYMNRACRDLLRMQRRIEEYKNEGGLIGLLKERLTTSGLEAMRMIYGQHSLWDQIWPREGTAKRNASQEGQPG